MLQMTTMTSKGQVTIPKRMRQTLGLKPGSDVAFDLVNGQVVVKKAGKLGKSRFAKVRGTLKDRLSTDQILTLLRGD
jgi:AbrB family looped-hinge helix DNA binding protein